MMDNEKIIQIIPCPAEPRLYATYIDKEKPEKNIRTRIVAFALVEVNENDCTYRYIQGVDVGCDSVNLVEDAANFDGYVMEPEE